MGHCVTAIIASSQVVERIIHGRHLVAVDLLDGLRLVPLEDEDLDSFGFDYSQTASGFIYLCAELSQFLAAQSAHGPLVYLETHYFGGIGSQAAAAFVGGTCISPTPLSGDGAINIALRSIGVVATGCDKFDYVGLSRYRHTADWKEAANA